MSVEEYQVKVYPDRTEWYQNGQLHRVGGPAEEWANGSKFWYQNNQLHRLDGPAREWANGDKFWYQNGQLHRLDGPAIEETNGNKFWFLHGQQYTYDEFIKKTSVKELSVADIEKILGYSIKIIKD